MGILFPVTSFVSIKTASANAVTKYVFEVTGFSAGNGWDDAYDAYNMDYKRGSIIEVEIDFSNNSFNTSGNWAVRKSDLPTQISNDYFASYAGIFSGRYNTHEEYQKVWNGWSDDRGWDIKAFPVTGKNLTLNAIGNEFWSGPFFNVGGNYTFETLITYKNPDNGSDELPSNIYVTLKSKNTSNGNSCGEGGVGSGTEYIFEVVYNGIYEGTEHSYIYKYNTGDKLKINVDFSNNKFVTSKSNWGIAKVNLPPELAQDNFYNFTEMFSESSAGFDSYKSGFWSDVDFTLKGNDYTLSPAGSKYFKSLIVGENYRWLHRVDYSDSSNDDGPRTRDLLVTLKSKSGGSGGGGNCGNGGGSTVIVNGGGGSLIEIPRYDYNHTSSNTNTTINQSTTGGKDLGKVTDDSKESILKSSLTNVPSNGVVYIAGDGFQPQLLIQYKNDNGLVASGVEEEPTVKKFLKDNNITTVVNTFDLNVIDTKGKSIEDFKNNYTSCSTTKEKGIECTKVTDKDSVKDMNNFKISKPGRYLVTIYTESGGENHLTYKIIDARSGSEFTGLPIINRLTAMIENKNIKEKNKNRLHDFDDLAFTFSNNKEDSMNVPSINNSITNRMVVGSTDKGVKLFNNDLSPSSLSDNSLDDASITDVIELDGTTKVAIASDNKGSFIIDTATGKIVKINSLLSDKVQSIEKLNNLFYISFDDAIAVYYVDATNTAHIRDSITSKDIFGSDTKLGEINLLGDKIMVNTHHESNDNRMAIVSKF